MARAARYRLGTCGELIGNRAPCHEPRPIAGFRTRSSQKTPHQHQPHTITPYPHPKKAGPRTTPLSNFLTHPNPIKTQKTRTDTPNPARYASPQSSSNSCHGPPPLPSNPIPAKAKKAYKHPPYPLPPLPPTTFRRRWRTVRLRNGQIAASSPEAELEK